MATSAQMARTSEYQGKLSNLQNSLKTATGTKAESIQSAINRTQAALSKIAPVSTVARSPVTSSQPIATSATQVKTPTPSYSYAAGSAAGPATFQQAKTATQTNTPVNIPVSRPVGTPALPPALPVVNKVGQEALPAAQQMMNPDFISTIENVSKRLYPESPKFDPYTSPFADDIKNTLSSILGYKRQQYDPNADISLQQAQDQAISETMRQAARRNMLYSEGTKTRSQQAAQGLIPAYQQRFEDLQQRDFENLQQTFGALGTADDRSYRQFMGNADLSQRGYTNKLDALRQATGVAGEIASQQAAQAKAKSEKGEDIRERYKNMFGRYLSDREIGFAEAYANASPAMFDYLDQHKADYQAEINRLESYGLGEDNPYIQALKGARMHKIQNDFEMGMAYGRDYGLEPTQKEQLDYFNTMIKSMDAEIKDITAGDEIAKSRLDIEKLKSDIVDKDLSAQQKLQLINDFQAKIDYERNLGLANLAEQQRRTDIQQYSAEQSAATNRARLSLQQQAENRLASKQARDEATKLNPYLKTVIGQIDKVMESFANTEYGNQTLADRVSIPGTVEHKRLFTLVDQAEKDGLITPAEGEFLYKSYGVPYAVNKK